MKQLVILIGLFVVGMACQPDLQDAFVLEKGDVYVLGSSWSVDGSLPSSRLFSALMHRRTGARVVHLGIAGESADLTLARLSRLSYPMPALIIIEAEGYVQPEKSDLSGFLSELRRLFPEVPLCILYLNKIPEAHKRSAQDLDNLAWIDLHKVRQEWSDKKPISGNGRFHQYLADYLSDKFLVH
jgi:hypothetical protein